MHKLNIKTAASILALLGAAVLATTAARAELQGRYLTADTSHGFDAYYDTEQNVTWLANALYGGRKDWTTADDWLAALRLGGYDDWRFPTFSNGSGNGTTGEFYHLWVVELGNNGDPQHWTYSHNDGPFTNVEYYMNSGAYNPTAAYWTDHTSGDQAMAWMTFNASYINQYREGTAYGVWPCRTGDSGWAPPPCVGPSITGDPVAVTVVCPGTGSVSFIATASGTGTLSFRWNKDSVPMNTAANPSAATGHLTLTGVGPADAGLYDCTVTNGCGNATSAAAQVFVSPADVGSQGGIAGRDGQYDNNDFIVFIDYFFSADSRADVGGQGGVLGLDGAFDNNDFVVFIDRFFAGC